MRRALYQIEAGGARVAAFLHGHDDIWTVDRGNGNATVPLTYQYAHSGAVHMLPAIGRIRSSTGACLYANTDLEYNALNGNALPDGTLLRPDAGGYMPRDFGDPRYHELTDENGFVNHVQDGCFGEAVAHVHGVPFCVTLEVSSALERPEEVFAAWGQAAIDFAAKRRHLGD